MLKIKSDWSALEKEIRRLKNLSKSSDKRKLDRVLEIGFLKTQDDVHVETGSLFLSGDKSSIMALGRYSGKISYGGPSGWINDPVDYAIYELDRGGHHDFMALGIQLMNPLWVETIRGMLRK